MTTPPAASAARCLDDADSWRRTMLRQRSAVAAPALKRHGTRHMPERLDNTPEVSSARLRACDTPSATIAATIRTAVRTISRR